MSCCGRKSCKATSINISCVLWPQMCGRFSFVIRCWTISFGPCCGGLYDILGMSDVVCYANGIAPMITFETAPIWFLLLIVLIPIEAGFHFYFFHRLLHVGKLYTWVHSWHHKNIQTGPGRVCMHPAESFFLRADILWFFLIPAHPIHVLFLIMHSTIGAPTSHTGFERVKVGKSKGLRWVIFPSAAPSIF